MTKRGQLIFKPLSEIILSAALIIIFLSATKSYASQEVFHKLAIARDLALTLDVVSGLHGDLEYTYPNEVSDYYIEIKENAIKVYSSKLGDLDPTPGIHNFVPTGNEQVNINIKSKKFIRIDKIGSSIKITGVD